MILKNNPSIQSFTGRIGQKDFIIIFILTFIPYTLGNMIIDTILEMPSDVFNNFINDFENKTLLLFYGTLLNFLIINYIRICACVKRLRDIKWCVWFGLLGCIPVVYLLFACFKSKYKKVLSSDDNTKSRKDIQKCQ